jgi:hypothetical protein
MELINNINNQMVFKLTGNSRIQVLNDYGSGSINKNNISFKDGNMFVTSSNSEHINVPDHKCHILFDYLDKIPNVLCVWDYDGYMPYYIQPSKNIDLKILDEFGIKENTTLYKDLSQINWVENKNEEILHKDYMCDRFIEDLGSGITHKNITYPSYIHTKKEFIHIRGIKTPPDDDLSQSDPEITYISSDCEYE